MKDGSNIVRSPLSQCALMIEKKVGLPGQSQGIFNQHSEAIPSAADKGANVLV